MALMQLICFCSFLAATAFMSGNYQVDLELRVFLSLTHVLIQDIRWCERNPQSSALFAELQPSPFEL